MKKIILFAILIVCLTKAFSQADADINSLNSNERFVITTSDKSITAGLAATFHHIFTINNPVGSGSVLNFSKILFFASGTNPMIPTTAFIFVNPTLVTTYSSAPINLSVGSSVADGSTTLGYNFSTTALSGGVSSPYELPLANGTNLLSGLFNLRPGNSIGIDVGRAVALGLTVNSGYFMIYYTKTPMSQ